MPNEEPEVTHYLMQITEQIKMADTAKDIPVEYMDALKGEYDLLLAIQQDCAIKPLTNVERLMMRNIRRIGTRVKQMEKGDLS